MKQTLAQRKPRSIMSRFRGGRMRNLRVCCRLWTLAILVGGLACGECVAHVQVMVPFQQLPDSHSQGVVELDIRNVVHAMKDGPTLAMTEPKRFGVLVNGRSQDLLGSLQARDAEGKRAYSSRYSMKEPGAHVFYLEPAGYWDADERVVVSHATKVIVNTCGAGLKTDSELGWENYEGWDTLVGLPVEIEPLVHCTAMWTHSMFRGVVRVDGKPAPFCRVEVEYLNHNGRTATPNNAFVTQIIKTDHAGEFGFIPVKSGWWAMTAIPVTDRKAKSPDGEEVPAELGGVLWISCVDMK